ncbi:MULTISPECIES: hypothetical protein [unclassified Synechococcus]|uniref:hypothetical protein n=1 Tax=unclassified Synechococcus TaxID=2626047 RepID=UPI001CF903E7|nr:MULTISPECIES: hypothetical protein [unclassified Synechococcus]MCB4378581.1 hypothetical protein [Synechococcus sp. MU1650]
MDGVLRDTKADVILFVDNDCFPLKREAVRSAIGFAANRRSFLGLAQASNHINHGQHIFAAPAFLAISRVGWISMGRPSCSPTVRGDVAEELSWRAEEIGLRYRAWYPRFFHHYSSEGEWSLGNYGYFGIGTIYQDLVFHLFQGRLNENVALFEKVSNAVVNNDLSLKDFRSCVV